MLELKAHFSNRNYMIDDIRSPESELYNIKMILICKKVEFKVVKEKIVESNEDDYKNKANEIRYFKCLILDYQYYNKNKFKNINEIMKLRPGVLSKP